jgi:hypothetical protein
METSQSIQEQLSRADDLVAQGRLTDGQYLSITQRLMEKWRDTVGFEEFIQTYTKMFDFITKFKGYLTMLLKYTENEGFINHWEQLIEYQEAFGEDFWRKMYDWMLDDMKERNVEEEFTLMGRIKQIYLVGKLELLKMKQSKEIKLPIHRQDLTEDTPPDITISTLMEEGILYPILEYIADEDNVEL